MALPAYPPMKSKYSTGPTPFEIEAQRRARRNERARLRMARKRAELKLQSEEEQARAAALNKEYQATYRERHRANLATQAKKRRYKAYQDRYGFAMFNLYMRAHRERRRMADARRRAQEGYHSGDDSDNGDNSDKETEANDRRSS
ncbi:hypothetical protein B0H13DRAFT_2313224 [Mycena leptocephala]|nr:hypothetical protein B0H13DRAFT_2320176 [Mycena leptocephala]KAJ7926727.1 hypothetical protein B0H13DRAFT_2313224 [Mycena leptocephala]